jgi:hypothetical protein
MRRTCHGTEIKEFRERRSSLYIRAVLQVERDSHKRIVIGAHGQYFNNLRSSVLLRRPESVRVNRILPREQGAVLAFFLAFLLSMAPTTIRAQQGGEFLLIPLSARAVGQGDAVIADTTLGTAAMWWNPASLSRLTKREIAVHHGQNVIYQANMVAFAVPSKVLGTLSVSGLIVDYGRFPSFAPDGTPFGGEIGTYNYQLAASYASAIGDRFSAGVTYKLLMFRNACSGYCGPNFTSASGSSNAVDFGAQYVLPTTLPVTLGAAIRNLGPSMPVRDAAQADPLPRFIQAGARVQIPSAALKKNNASLEVAGDILHSDAISGTALGMGVTLGYREMLFLQGGYKAMSQDQAEGGPSIGVGFRRGGFGIDIARRFDRLSSSVGEPPTFVTLRARF